MSSLHRSTLAAACATALLLTGGNALAGASTFGSLTGVTMTLIDLAPTDGITPWIVFADGPPSSVEASAYSIDPSAWAFDSMYGSHPFDPMVARAHANELAWADASIAGDPWAGTMSLYSAGYAQPAVASEASAIAKAGGPAYPFGSVSFTLSANTELVLSGQAEVSATTTAVAGEYEWAGSTATLMLYADTPYLPYSDRASLNASAVNGDFSDASQGLLSVTWKNFRRSAQRGDFQIEVVSHAGSTFQTLPTVPEPGPLALMFAGLLAMGVARARTVTSRSYPSP